MPKSDNPALRKFYTTIAKISFNNSQNADMRNRSLRLTENVNPTHSIISIACKKPAKI